MDLDDLLYRTLRDPEPTNVNGLHDQSLLCVTDLEDCCAAPRTVHGGWYYPNGSLVTLHPPTPGTTFLSNRGPNEIIGGQQFYGSVRLWRRWSNPIGRGRFRCELPSAADPNVNQTVYANIGEFCRT